MNAVIGYAHAKEPPTVEEIQRQHSVLTRTNPSYDSEGIQFANFILLPSIDNSIEYNDNIFSTSAGRQTDRVFIFRPEAILSSTFNRHFLGASAYIEHGKHQDFTGENYTDAQGAFSGRLDIIGDFSVPLKLKYERSHIKRGVPDENNVLKPTIVKTSTAVTGFDFNGQQLSGVFRAALEQYRFKDNATPNGFVDNSDRDRREVTFATYMGLSQDRLFAPYGYVEHKDISYRRSIDDNGFRRSSQSYDTGFGLNIRLSGVLSAKLQAGYNHRKFDDNRFDDINGLTYNANLVWEPSTLLALNANTQRTIEESTLSNFSASVDDNYALKATYELLPNVLVKPGVSYLLKDYEGSGTRELKRFTGDMGVTYKLNRKLWANANYEYIKQREDVGTSSSNNFENNIYTLSLKLKL